MEIVFAALIGGLAKLGEYVIKDGYEALKAAIKKKFGKDSDLSEAIEKLEEKPDSPGRQGTLREELAAARTDQDPEIMQAAGALLEELKALPGGQQFIQQIVTGNKNIFSATGDIKVVLGKTTE